MEIWNVRFQAWKPLSKQSICRIKQPPLLFNLGAPLQLQTQKIIDIDHRYRFGSFS